MDWSAPLSDFGVRTGTHARPAIPASAVAASSLPWRPNSRASRPISIDSEPKRPPTFGRLPGRHPEVRARLSVRANHSSFPSAVTRRGTGLRILHYPWPFASAQMPQRPCRSDRRVTGEREFLGWREDPDLVGLCVPCR